MLKITYINQQAPAPKVRPSIRLYETADRRRLVPEGHPASAFLFCGEGQEVSQAAFEAHELDESVGGTEVLEAETAGGVTEPASEAEAMGEAEEKAVEGPPHDKAVRKRKTKK